MNEDRAARYTDLFKDAPEDEQPAARYSDLFEDKHEHAPDCAYCPLCATISVVRKTKPEIVDHLANAARELTLAAGMFLEELGDAIGPEEEPPAEPPVADNVRRIDSV